MDVQKSSSAGKKSCSIQSSNELVLMRHWLPE
jgi:hypothetical protein